MNNKTRVFKNTAYLTISEVVIKAVGMLWVVLLAHLLTVEKYGTYNVVNSFVSIFAVGADLGVGLIIIREIAKDHEKARELVGNALVLKIFLSLVTSLLIIFSMFFLHQEKSTYLLVVIATITLIISSVRSAYMFYFDGTERMHYSALLNATNTTLSIVGGIVGLLLGFGLVGVFFGMMIGTIISTGVTYFMLTQKFIVPQIVWQKEKIMHTLREGLPLGIAAIASLIYSRIDSVILSAKLGDTAVGIYNAATPFGFALIQLLNVPFMVAVFPALSRVKEEDNERFVKAVAKSLIFVALWSIPVAVFVSIVSPIILPLIFGNKYNQAIPVLQVLIFYVPFLSLSALMYKVLIVIHRQKLYLYVSILGAFVNIILNLLFIPQFKILGAAYAAVLTQIIIFVIYSCILAYYFRTKR